MDLENIERLIRGGYDLRVKARYVAKDNCRYHASVDLGTLSTSHNVMGSSLKDALEGLERYVSVKMSPDSAKGEQT